MNAPRVLFAVAAGPRMGFGHVVRSRALARAMGAPHVVALRGTAATARSVRALGATVLARSPRAIARFRPDVIVIDEPSVSSAERVLQIARAMGVPAASIHDRGLARVDSDLVIDASLIATSRPGTDLAGPRFTILDPALVLERVAHRSREAGSVLIAIGGGAHVLRYGSTLAFGIRAALPAARVVVAPGFARGRRPMLPAGAAWLPEPRALPRALARCAVAVVGGGVTVAEACALATPVVAVAVVPAQHQNLQQFVRAGAIVDAGRVDAAGAAHRVASAVARLITNAPAVRQMTARARGLVDGRGASRVAAALGRLADHGRSWHAA